MMRYIRSCHGLRGEDLSRIDEMNARIRESTPENIDEIQEEALRHDDLFNKLAFAEFGAFRQEKGLALFDPNKTVPPDKTMPPTPLMEETIVVARVNEVADFDLID